MAQPTGYRAFIPAPLPPDPPLDLDPALSRLLSDADRALGRLDGVTSVLPNPSLFVAMYVRHEAVLSSQIEGTQSTLEDVLAFEADSNVDNRPKDVEEVVNYVKAMNYGLERLKAFPLSLRLIREIHGVLLDGVRGSEKSPGDFRKSQNWVGPSGCTLNDAQYVPPPPHEMNAALGDFEKFLHDRDSFPLLIHCGFAHAQFETIHPFLDGNGRIGRLLITLLLCERGVLLSPLLYLSYYFKVHRAQYYDRLMAVRHDGDWEGWLRFFLKGVEETSLASTRTARSILQLRERFRQDISNLRTPTAANLNRLLDHLFEHPVLSIRMAEEYLQTSFVTANRAMEQLEQFGVVREITGQQRNRRYLFQPYIDIFEKQSLSLPPEGSTAATTLSENRRREQPL